MVRVFEISASGCDILRTSDCSRVGWECGGVLGVIGQSFLRFERAPAHLVQICARVTKHGRETCAALSLRLCRRRYARMHVQKALSSVLDC